MTALLDAVVTLGAAIIPVALAWLGRMVRRIDRRTERVEHHDLVLFGDERRDADDGLVGSVDRLEHAIHATDGGSVDE